MVKKEMLKIYKPISNLDWMNYKLIKREIIEYLLKQFEYEHIEDKTSKGKNLIKYKYLERSLYEV